MVNFNKIKLFKVLAFSFLLGLGIYFIINKFQTSSVKASAPLATQGLLNATSWNFQEKGYIKLDGEWEFYWLKILNPESFTPPDHSFLTLKDFPQPTFQSIPSVWNSYSINGKQLDGHGYATYRLKVKIKDKKVNYAIRMQDVSTAYTVWIDGQILWKSGIVGVTLEDMEPSYKSRVIEFKPENEVIEIIFQVSNYHHAKGGLWNFIEFGFAKDIEESREAQTGFEFFMVGSLSIMAFYHFGLYMLRRKDKSTMYFGVVCIIIALRILLTGERYLFDLFDDSMYWSTLVKLEFMTVYLTPPFFILFLESIYPEDAQKLLARFTLGIGIFFSIAAIFTGTSISTGFVKYFQLILFFLIIYVGYILILINIRKRAGAFWIALGLVIFLATLVNDLLYLNNVIYTGFLFPVGLFVFIFSQSFILSMRFSKAFTTVELMSDKLLTLDKLKDDFMANTSHELRTPLNGIIGIAESMLDETNENFSNDTLQNLSLIVTSGRRLNSLVNDILDFSKLKNHEIELQIKKIDLKQIADLVLKLSEPLTSNKDLILLNDIPNDFPEIDADENRIMQILHNLIGNAIKFTESGQIKIFAEIKDHAVTIYVSDTGIGIPNSKFEIIFQSFEQMDNSVSREYGGTGLGLGITKQLIELHGGKIWVNSIVNKGSTFYFTLPFLEIEDNFNYTKEPATNPLFSMSKLKQEIPIPFDKIIDFNKTKTIDQKKKGFTILAVDDEPINLQVIANHLKDKNYTVITANNGKSALELVENELPDLVLLDVMMPKLSGYEVCKILRQTYPIHTMPIIILSAKNQTSDIIFGLECGANDYLPKPFHKKELLSRINNQLSIKKAIEDNGRLITMERELQTAKKIQENILPSEIPSLQGLKIFTTYIPMQAVGGDLYDFHSISETEIGILIADVAGHGVSAAIIMGMVKLAFKMHKKHAKNPARLLEKMNDTLYGIAGKLFVTAGYVYINLKKMEIEFSSAGHPALILLQRKSNDYLEMQPKGKILGAFPKIKCNNEKSSIKPGDKILMFTDGILEVRADSMNSPFYGEAMFEKFLTENLRLKGEEFQNKIIQEVKNYGNSKIEFDGFDDDITLVSIDIL